jgi:hypothetical protein
MLTKFWLKTLKESDGTEEVGSIILKLILEN